MITKNKLWEKIRTGLKDLDRSQRITENVMQHIRSLEIEADSKRTQKTD